MTLNLSSLQQKQDQLIYTIDEIVEWMRKVAGQTGYAQLQYYDKNGRLVTKNVPTIGQLIQQFQQGVNAHMAKVVYVHQTEGSDSTGDGSSSAPFKTITRAKNSVPPKGIVHVWLLEDHVEPARSSREWLEGRTIVIHGYNANKPTNRTRVDFTIAPLGNYNTVHGFNGGGQLIFSYCDIGFVDNSDPNLPFDSFAQIHSYATGTLFAAMYLTYSKVTLPDNPSIGLLHANGAGIGTYMFNAYNSEIVASGANSYAFHITRSSLILNIYSLAVSGAKTTVAELIAGIVRDSAGNPRNVISNLVL